MPAPGPSSDPIRVLHVITRMVKGGAQENTLATVAGIDGRGWESALITGPALGPEGSLEPACQRAGVRLIRVPELVREISPLTDLAALRKLADVFRAERPHIIHTHTSKAGILGRIAAKRARVPVVVHTPHGHVFHSYESGLKSKLFVLAERWCAPKADRLIALTESELREHLEAGVGHEKQWAIVHSGVDFGPFEAARGGRAEVRRELGLPRDALVLGTVGRLVPIKGQTYLIDAFAALSTKRPGLHLLIIGDGELREELIAQARERGLQVAEPGERAPAAGAEGGTVYFLGLRLDVARLLPALDLFVLPSLNEGMGRVLVEAMCVELPCVASRVSGIPDVVDDGETGLLVPPRDASALAAALETLLADPARMRAVGEAGRRKVVPEFSREHMIAKLEALYRALLAEKGIPAPEPPNI